MTTFIERNNDKMNQLHRQLATYTSLLAGLTASLGLEALLARSLIVAPPRHPVFSLGLLLVSLFILTVAAVIIVSLVSHRSWLAWSELRYHRQLHRLHVKHNLSRD